MDHDYLTVTALNQYIHQKFEKDPYLSKVYLTGELSNWRKRPGHQYFVIKDDHSVISAVMWKGAFAKVKFEPEEGMKVLITGRVTSFAKSGQYQIYVEAMQPDGVGNLYLAYEQLKKKLYAEGLFDESHKQPIPQYPKRIAVVTSQSGAVIRDIIDAVRKRDPHIQVVLYPAAVQGEGAAQEIANQIKNVNQNGNFDTLIIGRGGGSIEDLWPFNEEVVARAIYDSHIPVISSVGHQTDNTIADFVADQRASTPTQAGVIASPELTDVISNIRNLQNSLENSMRNLIKMEQQKLNHLQQSYVFRDPSRLYESYSQQVDLLSDKLLNVFKEQLQQKAGRLALNRSELAGASPRNLVDKYQNQLNYLNANLQQNIKAVYQTKKDQLTNKVDALDHLSPLKIMARGYGMVKDPQNQIIKKVTDVKIGETITVDLSDGSIEADVSKINQESEK
ncbi:exodeoxyribonuclease VII large subunit [Fructilactobacillus frigidiflavus]|uniref:exodeoxyribonuclease VII large subunit n=1 Tax=Fructilactobacillus frigidiflavus TaxID=3242688 RepID=UPI003757A764